MKTPIPYHKRTRAEQEFARRSAVKRLERGESPTELARFYGVSRQAIYSWRDAANSDHGLVRKTNGPPCLLSESQLALLGGMLLQGALARGFPTDLWTLERIRQVVAREFDIHYAPRSLSHVLHTHLNFSPQKPERRAREADPEKNAAWKRKFRRRGKKGAS